MKKDKNQKEDASFGAKAWMIYGAEKSMVIAKRLKNAVEDQGVNVTKNIFEDLAALRSLIVLRGGRGEYLALIEKGFDILLEKWQVKLSEKEGKQIIAKLQEENIPEDVLRLLGEVAYHLRDKKRLIVISEIVSDNREQLEDEKIYFRHLHTMATWQEAVEHNSKKSLELNKQVVEGAKDIDPVFYFKAKFGLVYNKALLPKQKVETFLEIAKEMEKLGDTYDAFRATVEAARAMLDLAKQQGTEEQAFENIEKSKNIALEALKLAKDIGYVNLEIIAAETLEVIYLERLRKLSTMKEQIEGVKNTSRETKKEYGLLAKTFKDDERKAKSFQNRAKKLREKFDYSTQFNRRYKDTFFEHAD